ncbi:MAG: lasso peptide biosynthesis B2 protein [Thermodesulfobacteriota bacterium]
MVLNGNFVIKIRANLNSFEDVRLFIQIFILVTVLPILIKLLSLPRLMKLLTPNGVKVFNNQDSDRTIEKVVKYTGYILSRNFWIYKAICWKRALVLYHFLRKAGLNVQICFGVRLPNIEAKDELEGHAWLIYNGGVFLERDIEMTKTYKATYSYPETDGEIIQDPVLKQS